jgi:hypothetical protein
VILGAGASRAATPKGDRFGRRLPLMSDLIEEAGLRSILRFAGITPAEANIEAVYGKLAASSQYPDILAVVDSKIRAYFQSIEIPNHATFYDYLLLSLREKDVVATFNWDPLLLQSYRRNATVHRLPKILFLHGNVAIGLCLDCRIVGPLHAACPRCARQLKPSRLLYPVADKDYTSDPFIRGEWDALKRALGHAYIVTIVGYSAPTTDAAAVELLQQVWDQNQTRELAQIEIVDVQSRRRLLQTWKPFIVREHYHITKSIHFTLQTRYPRRSCDAFASSTLLLSPWPVNQMPRLRRLDRLQSWIQPLLQEEDALDESGRPFSGATTRDIRGLAT